jgi:hypothetical protein
VLLSVEEKGSNTAVHFRTEFCRKCGGFDGRINGAEGNQSKSIDLIATALIVYGESQGSQVQDFRKTQKRTRRGELNISGIERKTIVVHKFSRAHNTPSGLQTFREYFEPLHQRKKPNREPILEK